MASADPDFPESSAERWANVLTHGLGVVASLIAMAFLLLAARSPAATVAAAIFGVTLILLYLASCLYHAMRTERSQAIFKIADHCCIYLLIAGSYTPIALVALRGGWGWSLFGLVWGLALAGIAWKILDRRRKGHWVSTILYLAMGWLVLVFAKPLLGVLHPGAILWLVLGGASYSLGVIFFAWHRLRFSHAIWHLFVLGGSTCHVIAAAGFVLGHHS